MLQDLYNSEINAAVWWNWDGGFEVRIGSGLYGEEKNWEASDNVGNNYDDVEKWFVEKAKELYPKSTFVKNLPDYSEAFNNFMGDVPVTSLDNLTIKKTPNGK